MPNSKSKYDSLEDAGCLLLDTNMADGEITVLTRSGDREIWVETDAKRGYKLNFAGKLYTFLREE